MNLLKYLLIVLVTSLIISAVGSCLLNKGLRKSSIDFFGKINAARDSSNIDIFLIGSSRMLVQSDPRIIDSITGFKSYNYGLNAVSVKTCYNILQYATINNTSAKLAVFNIDYNMFEYSKDPYKDAFYYPFEKESPSFLLTETNLNQNIHRLKIFDISMYDDMAKYAGVIGFLTPGKSTSGMYKGYYPSTIKNHFEIPDTSYLSVRSTPFSENGLNLLSQIIKICKQKAIEPIFVLAPYRQKYSPENFIINHDTIISRVKTLAKNEEVYLLDYTQNILREEDQFFYNSSHLNEKGAKIYSALLGNDLKMILNKTNK